MYGIEAALDMAQLFEYVPDVHFWIKDAEGRFRAANLAFVRHFGFRTFREIEGKTDFDLHPRACAEEYARDDRAVLLSRKVLANKMELVSELDRSLKWYCTSKIPLRDAAGKCWGTAGFTRPVSAFEGGASPVDSLTRAVDRIQRDFACDLDVASLAALAGLSMDRFKRNFRKAMKETPAKYINKTRMRAACQLLIRSDFPIAEVARRSGFPDANYFSKRFFLYLRISPSEYRMKFRPK